MSEITEDTMTNGLRAGNTNETLSGTDRDAVVTITLGTGEELTTQQIEETTKRDGLTDVVRVTDTPKVVELEEDPLDDENTFDVSRAEFTEMQDAFLRLENRILKHNQGAPHKI